jgi:DNA invertase Pin-like site-specific DNA recombinase
MTAAIYARKSTDQSGVNDEQRSVARQVEHARAYANRKGCATADAGRLVGIAAPSCKSTESGAAL